MTSQPKKRGSNGQLEQLGTPRKLQRTLRLQVLRARTKGGRHTLMFWLNLGSITSSMKTSHPPPKWTLPVDSYTQQAVGISERTEVKQEEKVWWLVGGDG